ncbi:hypothetical protein AVEN_185425-1 [Araneus ventricosus]|uniref:Uncharacterized protein n=1 Tax=Araneus ventricosus TaxID=182803 RepID=A0A4Y2CHN7_ARAVE|nr:hypothetical protein AVEN_185425-1 [Araneus ventricosus]
MLQKKHSVKVMCPVSEWPKNTTNLPRSGHNPVINANSICHVSVAKCCACCALIHMQWVKRPATGVVPKFEEGTCQLRCRPRHLTAVQNYNLHPENSSCVASKQNVNITTLKLSGKVMDYPPYSPPYF